MTASNLISLGATGTARTLGNTSWDTLGLPEQLRLAAQIVSRGGAPTPLQKMVCEQGIFSSRRNLLVTAATNSGKTLVGYLVMLEALAQGKRAVLIEPLRALAREKADELEEHSKALASAIGRKFKVRVSTGDYRLENESFSDPAPGAELIIATPERLEAILRSPDNATWFSDLGAVCVDEVHMIGEPRRGPTLECLITSMLLLPVPPRLALLSATISGTDRLAEWLRPCDVIELSERTPPLEKFLLDHPSDRDEDADMAAANWLKEELSVQETQALVFIYQANRTKATADRLNAALEELAGPAGVLPYHSQMSPAMRDSVRQRFTSGQSRVVVTTSALGMGVNLPATHVVVRDLTYRGTRSPGLAEVLQMMGRAGRGAISGKALVIKRPADSGTTSEWENGLRTERIAPLKSALISSNGSARNATVATEPVASLLARSGDQGRLASELEAFFERSLGGQEICPQVSGALRWMQDETLAYLDEATQRYHLTVLGQAAVSAVLPLPLAAGFGRLLRDLLSLDKDSEYLGRWSPLDSIIVLDLLHADIPSLRRYSADLNERVISWLEGHSKLVPVLFRHWLRGAAGHSNAAEVLGSLGISPATKVADVEEWSRQQGVLAVFRAIVLYERATGRSVQDLSRQFGIENLDGVEEKWRDTMLWLLGGVSQLLDVRSYYFHLCNECSASPERVKEVKKLLTAIRRQTLELIEQVKFASPLGSLVLAMRRRTERAGVGVESIRRLEAAGINSMADIIRLSPEQLRNFGLRRDVANRISKHMQSVVG